MKNPEENEMDRKRKNNPEENDMDRKRKYNPEDDSDFLALSLSCRPIRPRHSPPKDQHQPIPTISPQIPEYPNYSLSKPTLWFQNPPQIPLRLPPNHPLYIQPFVPPPPPSTPSHLASDPPSSRPVRSRRNPTQGPREGKSHTISPPFPWATNLRATVHKLSYLLQKQILTITGMVRCTKCEKDFEMGFDLEEKLAQVWNFIAKNKSTMHDRAPLVWMNPVLVTCKYCSRESAKPIISEKKQSINWLFLLLGQLLGCCTLEQLKYFCKHTHNHRTGAKDRVLYLTYLGLCKQLVPDGPFDR